MMRSLSSGVSGLRSHQTKMDVIGNNIANVNTYGFKSSRVTFSDVFYQTLSTGSAPGNMGGTNPTQIGYGASVATIDVLNSASGMASTDRALDMYINGDGMIATQDSSGNLRFSRLGILGIDAAGNLVDVNGNFVMGFPMSGGVAQVNPDGSCDVGNLQKITIDEKYFEQLTDIAIDRTGTVVGTLPGESEAKPSGGIPNWLHNVEIDPDSNLTNNINIAMEYHYVSTAAAPSGNNWISNVQAIVNSKADGTYTFSYQDGTIKATNTTTGEVLSGQYVRGTDVVLSRSNGEEVLTVTTDNLNTPSNTANAGNMTFAKKQYISFSGTDKGGNKIGPSATLDPKDKYRIEYTNQDKLELGEGTTKITVYINRQKLEYAEEFSFSLDQAHGISWLESVSIASNPDRASAGNVYLEYGLDYSINTSFGSGDAAYNWIPSDAFGALLKGYCETNGDTDFGYRIVASAAGFTFEIYDANDPTTTILRSGTHTAAALANPATLANIRFSLASDATKYVDVPNRYKVTDAMTNLDLTDAANHGDFASYNVGSGTSSNVIRLRDGNATGAVLAETTYNGGDTITLDDFIITVSDPDDLQDVFDQGQLASANGQLIGRVTTTREPQWLFDKTAASVKTIAGEQITLGVIALGSIPNMTAMIQDGESYFLESGNSGEASFWRPGTGNVGTMEAGYLEMSNVDISKEFTEMITTQRGFQANTRIITVSDEMLQELVNLKR